MLSALRRTRLTTALVALLSLLFMQLAVAGYVCPGASSKATEVATMVQSGMPCADKASMAMEDAQLNLCKAHCQSGQQSADTYQLPSLVAFAAVLAAYPPSVAALVPVGVRLQTPLLRRSTAPPLAVRNCCFRI